MFKFVSSDNALVQMRTVFHSTILLLLFVALLPLDRCFFATAVIVQQQDADDGVLQKKKKAKLQLADIMQSIISELVLVQQAA